MQEHILRAPGDIATKPSDVLSAAQYEPTHTQCAYPAKVAGVELIDMNGHQLRMDPDRDRRMQLRQGAYVDGHSVITQPTRDSDVMQEFGRK